VFVVSMAVAYGGSLLLAPCAGVLLLAVLLWLGWRRAGTGTDFSRRAFLRGAGVTGLGLVAGGAGLGRVVQRATRPDPGPVVRQMARGVGAEAMNYLKRGHFPGRSGDLQLVLAPFNTSNYSFESLDLAPKDPRSSHAMGWGYTERIPLLLYAPGIVSSPADLTDRVTLADLAPSMAALMGFDFSARDGRPLPGLPSPGRPPKLIVTYVIDGGGWNVLNQWPTAWPTLRALMGKALNFRDAVMGSFPSVTACAHATIGTGAFPAHHGVSGHWIRLNGRIDQAYGTAGRADPSRILTPTLADQWTEETRNRAWVGEIGYQVWHLGMLGRGGRPLGKRPVAIYYDEDVTKRWQPHNPDLYRLPDGLPGPERLSGYLGRYFGPVRGAAVEKGAGRKVCCSPPIIQYQGDVLESTLVTEPVGTDDVTDLLFVNYKMPDYTGHVYNMLSIQEKIALAAVDRQLARLVSFLESRFEPGEFALFVTADHGQCPLVDVAGGVRLDPIQLAEDINNAFGRSMWALTSADDVRPSEVYLDERALWDAGVRRDDIAAFLADYRYGDNVGPYVHPDVVARDRRTHPEFAGVFSTNFITGLDDRAIASFGSGQYARADPGLPALA
jgi:Type I phosphodiesterase / nucleotide pyrophosphatase